MSELSQDGKLKKIRGKMLDLDEVNISPINNMFLSWIKPVRMNFLQNKVPNAWDVIKSPDSIAIVVFNISRKKLVFVKQFRPHHYLAAVHWDSFSHVDVKKYPSTLGITMELCTGTIDKNLCPVEIAVDELKEKCGYEAPVSAFEKINIYRSSVAPSTAAQTLLYVEVTDKMKKHEEGGCEEEDGEVIEIVEMSVEEVKNYIKSEDVHNLTFLYGVNWFLLNKKDRYL